MKKLIKRLFLKQNPRVYEEKDAQLTPSLRTRDLIGLGTGMVVGTAIFTLPGIVAAEHTGPAVPLAFIVAAIGAGLSALAYAETSSVLPFAGSAFSWINVLFGEFFGWIAGWALLAEYFISVAFVASGWSAYMQGFLGSFGIKLPHALTGGFDPHTGSYIDILAAFAILIVGILISRGVHQVSRIENIIVKTTSNFNVYRCGGNCNPSAKLCPISSRSSTRHHFWRLAGNLSWDCANLYCLCRL